MRRSGSAPSPNYSAALSNGLTGNGVTYDLANYAGNVTYDGFHSYMYDAEGRLYEVVDQTICYTYDGDGDRVATTNCNVVNGGGGNTTGIISEFLYDIDHRLASQINISTEKLTRANIYAGGEFLAEDAPDAAETGTPVATQMRVTDQVGSLRGRWDYAGKQNGGCTSFPYGDGFSCTNPSTALFTGKDRDNESALDYFGARYYSNRMGRFSSPDPSQLYYADPGNPQSLNLYSYALNSPLTNTDPTGLYCAWEDGTSDDDPSDGGDSERDCNSQGGHWTDQSNPCHGADGCVTTFNWNQLQTEDAPITTMIDPSSGAPYTFYVTVTATSAAAAAPATFCTTYPTICTLGTDFTSVFEAIPPAAASVLLLNLQGDNVDANRCQKIISAAQAQCVEELYGGNSNGHGQQGPTLFRRCVRQKIAGSGCSY